MTRLVFAVYGLLTYLFFLGVFLYAAAFVANIPGLKTMDNGPAGTLTEAIVVDLLLLGLFAVQHSVAAAVEEQGAATREIARNIQHAAGGTSEVSSNIVGVSTASAEAGAAAGEVLSASAALRREADVLRSEIDAFLSNIRAA